MSRTPLARGFTLIELCLLLVLFALLSALAVPSLSGTLSQARVRGVLNRVAGEIYLARALAARAGRPHTIRFDPPTGCADLVEVRDDERGVARRALSGLLTSGVCLESNVARPMRVNGRGMLSGAARKIRVTSGSAGDSATVSLVGRVYRWP